MPKSPTQLIEGMVSGVGKLHIASAKCVILPFTSEFSPATDLCLSLFLFDPQATLSSFAAWNKLISDPIHSKKPPAFAILI